MDFATPIKDDDNFDVCRHCGGKIGKMVVNCPECGKSRFEKTEEEIKMESVTQSCEAKIVSHNVVKTKKSIPVPLFVIAICLLAVISAALVFSILRNRNLYDNYHSMFEETWDLRDEIKAITAEKDTLSKEYDMVKFSCESMTGLSYQKYLELIYLFSVVGIREDDIALSSISDGEKRILNIFYKDTIDSWNVRCAAVVDEYNNKNQYAKFDYAVIYTPSITPEGAVSFDPKQYHGIQTVIDMENMQEYMYIGALFDDFLN